MQARTIREGSLGILILFGIGIFGGILLWLKGFRLGESGFVFEINHLNGKRLALNNMNNPTVVRPGFKRVVNGMGINKDNSVGNLVIEFEVEFPDSLTTEQVESLRNAL